MNANPTTLGLESVRYSEKFGVVKLVTLVPKRLGPPASLQVCHSVFTTFHHSSILLASSFAEKSVMHVGCVIFIGRVGSRGGTRGGGRGKFGV